MAHIRAVGKWTEKLRSMCEERLNEKMLHDKRGSFFKRLSRKAFSKKRRLELSSELHNVMNLTNDNGTIIKEHEIEIVDEVNYTIGIDLKESITEPDSNDIQHSSYKNKSTY